MRAPDCLDSTVYEPDEEHATALVLNAKERMDPAWNASRDRADGERCSQSKQRDKERCLFREIAKKRRSELTLHARLGRQDKARFLAAGTSFLSFCLHIVLCGSDRAGEVRRERFRYFLLCFQRSERRRPRCAGNARPKCLR